MAGSDDFQFVRFSPSLLAQGFACAPGTKGRLADKWPVRDGTASRYPLQGGSRGVVPAAAASTRFSFADVIWLQESVDVRRHVIDGDPEVTPTWDFDNGPVAVPDLVRPSLGLFKDEAVLFRHCCAELPGLRGWLTADGLARLQTGVLVYEASGSVDMVLSSLDDLYGAPLPSALCDVSAVRSELLKDQELREDPLSVFRDRYMEKDFDSLGTLLGLSWLDGRLVPGLVEPAGPQPSPRPLASLYSDLERCKIAVVPCRFGTSGWNPPGRTRTGDYALSEGGRSAVDITLNLPPVGLFGGTVSGVEKTRHWYAYVDDGWAPAGDEDLGSSVTWSPPPDPHVSVSVTPRSGVDTSRWEGDWSTGLPSSDSSFCGWDGSDLWPVLERVFSAGAGGGGLSGLCAGAYSSDWLVNGGHGLVYRTSADGNLRVQRSARPDRYGYRKAGESDGFQVQGSIGQLPRDVEVKRAWLVAVVSSVACDMPRVSLVSVTKASDVPVCTFDYSYLLPPIVSLSCDDEVEREVDGELYRTQDCTAVIAGGSAYYVSGPVVDMNTSAYMASAAAFVSHKVKLGLTLLPATVTGTVVRCEIPSARELPDVSSMARLDGVDYFRDLPYLDASTDLPLPGDRDVVDGAGTASSSFSSRGIVALGPLVLELDYRATRLGEGG